MDAMKLVEIYLKNFRAYREEVRVQLGDLTAFIGRNDVGKSTVLEALDIFFDGGTIKLDCDDACVTGDKSDVVIGCVFEGFPTTLTLDAGAPTTLADEHLLNRSGKLEIHRHFDCSGAKLKSSISAVALHPTGADVGDLLQLKNNELKNRWRALGVTDSSVNLAINPTIRKALWHHQAAILNLQETEVPLDKEDAKKVWDAISKHLPLYALFKSDRASSDDDNEVTVPVKFAIAKALKTLEEELKKICDSVDTEVTEVMTRTLEKLRVISPDVADTLSHKFHSSPKWESVFKDSGIQGSHGIPINKRGSGVRRLILLSFFQAEAERRKAENGSSSNVIYAIEEPETSQHPSNQKLLIEAFKELSNQPDCQVLVTTHVPGLAGYIPVTDLRFVRQTAAGIPEIVNGTEDIYEQIATTLGVHPANPEADRQVRLIVCVEGPNDVEFFHRLSTILNQYDPSIPNLETDPRFVVTAMGGNALQQWVNKAYLKKIGLPEAHIYDSEDPANPKYAVSMAAVNARKDGSWAVTTSKREAENYLHPDAITAGLGITITYGDLDDVPLLAAAHLPRKNVKKLLNTAAVDAMTHARLLARDPNGDVIGWLTRMVVSAS